MNFRFSIFNFGFGRKAAEDRLWAVGGSMWAVGGDVGAKGYAVGANPRVRPPWRQAQAPKTKDQRLKTFIKIITAAMIILLCGHPIARADEVLVPDFRVDQDPTPNDIGGVASSLTYGYFVVSYLYTNPPTYIGQCYARRFDLGGNPLGNAFRVDSLSGTACGAADVTIDTNGNMIFTWPDDRSGSNHIYFRRFAPNENPLSPDTLVDQGTLANYDAEIAPLASGGFIIVWDDTRSRGGSIYARLYDSSGSPVGSDFQVDQNPDINNTAGESSHPVVATSPTGQIYIAWTDSRNRGLTGNVYARLFNSSGTPLGSDFQVDQSPNRVIASSIAATPNGNFIVLWDDCREDGDFGLPDAYGRVFDSSGNPLTGDIKILQSASGDYSGVATAASDMIGRFAVTCTATICNGICLRHLDSAGNYMDMGVKIDAGSASYPHVTMVGNMSFMTVFDDSRSGSSQIWANITGPANDIIPMVSAPALIFLVFVMFCLVLLKSRFINKKSAIFIPIIFLVLFSKPVYAQCPLNPDFPPPGSFSLTTLYGDRQRVAHLIALLYGLRK